mmetsp:Transcript_6328/g.14492  ORF Transcript_6328/g.14492 Transcript_6328/m.14492 type:complete len:276 (+) Transcript_6328:352-1179(+)
MVKSSSLGSSWTFSTICISALLSASCATARVRTWPSSPSSFSNFSSFRCFSCNSCSSFSRSASSLFLSSSRSLFSAASSLLNSRANSASLQALRFLARSTRFCSLSRSSFLRCAAAPPDTSEAPYSSSILASKRALQPTAVRSSSHSSSSSLPTRKAAFCAVFHLRMNCSVFSSSKTLISCPAIRRLLRQVAAFQADSGSPNCATPKLMALPSASLPRRNACKSPHCSRICCMCDSSTCGASCAMSMKSWALRSAWKGPGCGARAVSGADPAATN